MTSMTNLLSVKDWDKVKVIGRGGSSTVYQCVVRATQERLAVKEIATDGMTPDQIRGIGGEVDTIKNLSHDNIVRCLGSEQVANRLYIMLEYCGRGSLRKLYQDNGRLSEPQAARCITLVLRGLDYLHANGVAHRDVKGANILLTAAGELKLADFGASKKMETESLVSGLKGTPHWMAPEVIKGTQMSTGWMKADVWSLGCTLVEILSASLPFSEYDNPMTAMYQIANGKIPPLPSGASADASSFVHDCCAADPEQRPAVSALLQHPFLRRCRSGDGDEFSDESALFELPPSLEATTASLMLTEGSTDVEISVAVQSPSADESVAEDDMLVDDAVRGDHSADVNKFIEQRKGQVRTPIGGLSVRTSSFRVADGELVGESLAALECQDTPVLHKTRKGIHTMSTHNMLKLTDSQSTATTPALGASRRPPLQVTTSRDPRMSVSSVSGIAQGAMVLDSSNDSDIADAALVEDVMESVISPRLTSLKVFSTENTHTAFNSSRPRTFSAVDAAAENSRASTAVATPEQPPVVVRPEPLPAREPTVAPPSVQSSSPLVPPPEPGPIVFKIGCSDASKSGGQTGTKNITPMKRKHRASRKPAHYPSGHKEHRVDHRSQGQHIQNMHSDNSCSAQKIKIGTVSISGPRDNSQTPTTKTMGGMDPLLQPRNSPRVSPRGTGDDSSTDIVFTSSGGQKRKLRATPAGNGGGVPHKVSTNSRRGHSKGANSSNSQVDLVKASSLPPIGANQPAVGLAGKKKDNYDLNSKANINLVGKADTLLRPSAPMSGDKLQYSGEVHTASVDGNIAHGSSTGSTTISQACAIAAESNFGKIGEVLVDGPKRHEKGDHRTLLKHHTHRHHGPHHPVAPDHRHARQAGMPKGRLASIKHSSIRSHSAGVVPTEITALPTSNNLSSSSSRPQLPMLHKNKGIGSDGGDDVLRAIQTAPAPSRLPPIGGAPSEGTLGSLTPVDRLLTNASPSQEGLAPRYRR